MMSKFCRNLVENEVSPNMSRSFQEVSGKLVVLLNACGGGSRSVSLRINVLSISVHPVDSFSVEICRVFPSRISDF